jgi:hypothetical protein
LQGPFGALAPEQEQQAGRERRERFGVGSIALLGTQLARNRVRGGNARSPDRRGSKLLQRIGIESGVRQEEGEKLLALVLSQERVEPGHEFGRDLRDARGGLVHDKSAKVAGERGGAECHRRAV